MTLRKIPLKPLTTRFGDQDKFNYKYVDAMVPKQDRYRNWLLQAAEGPIWINWEGYPKFNKDLRQLVKLGFLELKRNHISTCRNMSKLHITELDKSNIKDY
tara:strand:+ start:62 stop:364 length:303 start_codon:yes stop_codon:yes gene_type:complete